MQFLVLCYDGSDSGAKERRLAARSAHLALCEQKIATGEHLAAAAMLDDAGNMIGSAMMVDFKDRAALDEWLTVDPYVIGKVWQRIEITPCKLAPPFAHVLSGKKQ